MYIAALCLQIHAMGHYLAIKREEILIHDTTWMDLENIMLNEISQSQKGTYYTVSAYIIYSLAN